MNFRSISIVAAALVAAITFGQNAQVSRPVSQTTQISSMAAMPLMATPSVVSRSTKLGHADPNMVMHLTVNLPYASGAAMQAFADSVSDPSNPNFRQFLTPTEVGTRFGLSTDKLTAITSYLTSKGLTVDYVAQNRLGIRVSGPVSAVESAFATQINRYQTKSGTEPGRQSYYSYAAAPSVPSTISAYVQGVSGMQNFTKPKTRTTLSPNQVRQLYGLTGFYASGNRGQGRSIAISNWVGYRLNNVTLFYNKFALPTPAGGVGANIHIVSIDGANGQSATENAEADLDIQMVLGQAPLCNFYVYDNADQGDLVGLLTKEANDNIADVISESYGWFLDPGDYTAAHNIHLSMTAQGITYMAATGDSGTSLEPFSYSNYDGEVLMVGGTSETTDGAGNRQSEVAWRDGGGGWSSVPAPFNIKPAWQKGTGVPTNINKRLSPDVAAAADYGSYFFFLNGKINSLFGGTSFSSPVWAGMLGVAEQHAISIGQLPANKAGKQRVGRLQDLIYRQNGRPDVWFDVTNGSNGVLPNGVTSFAHAGWDFTTGWGAINWANMSLQSVVNLRNAATFLGVFEGGGQNGSGNALVLDNFYFRITPATVAGLGQVGSASYQFTLPTTVNRSTLQEIDFTTITKFVTGSTGQVFLYNFTTGKWDLLKSFSLTGTGTTNVSALKTNFTTYVTAAGQYRILVRGLLPSGAGVTGNSFDTDYVTSNVLYLPS
jgi:subtilase family serine protease